MSIPHVLSHIVFEIPGFETPQFCARIVERAETMGFEPATIISEQGAQIVPDIRNNDRVIFDDPSLAAALWQKTQPLFAKPFKGMRAIGLNERFRVYRYGPGQFFDWHQDGAYDDGAGNCSKFTMLIYLNDEVEGGGTSFSDMFSPHAFSDFTIAPKAGSALFFHHALSHRGDPIVSGRKYVLRSDVMFSSER